MMMMIAQYNPHSTLRFSGIIFNIVFELISKSVRVCPFVGLPLKARSSWGVVAGYQARPRNVLQRSGSSSLSVVLLVNSRRLCCMVGGESKKKQVGDIA